MFIMSDLSEKIKEAKDILGDSFAFMVAKELNVEKQAEIAKAVKAERQALAKQIKQIEKRIKQIDTAIERIRKNMI